MQTGQVPRIKYLKEKRLVGLSRSMSLIKNETRELWSAFLPLKDKVQQRVSSDYFSMQIYPEGYFISFNPAANFIKWATVEVVNFENVPESLSTVTIPEGRYAVFIHRGANTNTDTFEYIFRNWLPRSGYKIDNRPHFEILGKKYKNNDPDSEEEVWIPIRKD